MDVAFNVDETALDAGIRPAVFNGFQGSFLSVCCHDFWWCEFVKELAVGVGILGEAPVPRHNMVGGGGNKQTVGVEVGAVDEDLVVHTVVVSVVRNLDCPKRFKPSCQCTQAMLV